MSGSVNKVILLGNLGRDPEVRAITGGKVCNLTVATSERWTDKAGEKQERTEWHRVVLWNEKLVEIAERYLHKGSSVYLEGTLVTRKWTDQSGQEKYTTEIVLQRFRGELVLLGGESREPARPSALRKPAAVDLDDEIPFSWAGLAFFPLLGMLY